MDTCVIKGVGNKICDLKNQKKSTNISLINFQPKDAQEDIFEKSSNASFL